MRWSRWIRARWIRAAAGVALLVAGFALATPGGADVTAVGQGAAAFLINVDITNQGPIETVIAPVNLPPAGGGPFTDAVATFDEPLLQLEAEALATSTQGGNLGSHAGFATSSAALANLLFDELVGADSVRTECTANGNGVSATTTLVGGIVNDGGVGTALPVNPAPNTQFNPAAGIVVTVNEQIVTTMPGSIAQVVVNGLHVQFAPGNPTVIVGDVWIAQSICRASGPDVLVTPEPPPVVEPVRAAPRFTG